MMTIKIQNSGRVSKMEEHNLKKTLKVSLELV